MLSPLVLGITPARSGSKAIPGKNIVQVAGQALLAYTVRAGLGAHSLDRLIVSTDSEDYAAIARSLGAEVPFLRPVELSQDDTPGIDPVLHAVQWLEQHQGYQPDYVMLLQPTSPLRTVTDIEAVVHLAIEQQADAVVSVCTSPVHPYWTKQVMSDRRLVDFLPLPQYPTRRQDLPNVYALNGAIYLIRRTVLLERKTLYPEGTYAYVMPPERSLDIDTPWDLYLADLILRDQQAKVMTE